MTKICSKCKLEKPISEFSKDKTKSDGLNSSCKICKSKYYNENREQITQKQSIYNKAHANEINEKMKAYGKENRKLISSKEKERLKVDIDFKIRKALRIRIWHIIKGNSKTGSAVSDLGCSMEEFKAYMESKFKLGMTWENYGEWEIDHIKPLSKFDLSKREEFLVAANYTNLQPLWSKENIKKGNKYEQMA